MEFHIFTADCTQVASNVLYPHECAIRSPADLAAAAQYDNVCGKFKNHHRSNDNFIHSDCIMLDCDNTDTDKEEDWISPNDVAEQLEDVTFVAVPSRNHMKPKDGKSPRPKHHYFFPITPTTDAEAVTNLKRTIQARFPFFDIRALDAAHFAYGATCSEGDIYWHEGIFTIDQVDLPECDDPGIPGEDEVGKRTIPKGSRNNEMHSFACTILKKYGDTPRARAIFDERATDCEPPLPKREIEQVWGSAVKFFHKIIATDPSYKPSKDFALGALKPSDYSDVGEARVLAKEYGDELKYTTATDYLCFDGIAWRESKPLAVGTMEELLDYQLADAKTIYAAAEKEFEEHPKDEEAAERFVSAKKYLGFVVNRRNYKYIASALQAARPMVLIEVGDLDKDPHLLNTPDGTIDLRTGEVQPHNASDLITKCTAVSPGEKGTEVWERQLSMVFGEDKELIGYVQQVCGLAAIGQVYVEALLIAYGEGSNGKSTFWNTIRRVLGSYSGSISADTLTVGCRRNVKPELAEAKGKRLLIAAELEEGTRLNTSIVKQLCSTDEVAGEKKYKDPFSFIPSHTLVLYTNHLPRVGAQDEGIWRRLIVIPFTRTIRGKADIKNYADYLVDQAGPAILSWIIEGARMVIGNGYHIDLPEVVKDAIDKYRHENDWFGHFLDDCCEVDPSYSCKSGDLYSEYCLYADRARDFTRNAADFYGTLEQRGFIRKRKKGIMYVIGLRLRDDSD